MLSSLARLSHPLTARLLRRLRIPTLACQRTWVQTERGSRFCGRQLHSKTCLLDPPRPYPRWSCFAKSCSLPRWMELWPICARLRALSQTILYWCASHIPLRHTSPRHTAGASLTQWLCCQSQPGVGVVSIEMSATHFTALHVTTGEVAHSNTDNLDQIMEDADPIRYSGADNRSARPFHEPQLLSSTR